MSKLGKALGITAAITGIAGIAAGTYAIVKKCKGKKVEDFKVTEVNVKKGSKSASKESFEEHINKIHVHKEGHVCNGDCDCDCDGEECTCTTCCAVECDETMFEDSVEEVAENKECLKDREDCETCDFKDGCKLK